MSREVVDNVLRVINTATDKKIILKCLTKIRSDFVNHTDGIKVFYEAGGIPPVIRFLHKPHEQILHVALSILGNSCTNDDCCKEAFENNIVAHLMVILKSISNPLIQSRACRLLGNLAKSDAGKLLGPRNAVMAKFLCGIIADASDVQTRIMAFRACRFLLADAQFLKLFLQLNGFVVMVRILAATMKNDKQATDEDCPPPSLGLKHNQHREKYFEEVARNLEGVRSDIFDHEVMKRSPTVLNAYAMPKERAAQDLACEILKCLTTMSKLTMSLAVWEMLNRSGATFAPIVYFASEDNKHRCTALKILSNFSKNPGSLYILSASDAIAAACELLVSPDDTANPLTMYETRCCIVMICMLSVDACNRSKIRRSGALRKIIAMLRESKSQTEISSILHLLNNFQYDSMSMDLMLKDGLISILIKELNVYLSSDDEYHKKKREEKQQNTKKRKMPREQVNNDPCKFAKLRDECSIECESPSSSPQHPGPVSPCSSRSMSPADSRFFRADADGASDDETYSPVCSDDEDDEDEGAQGDSSRPVAGDGVVVQPGPTENNNVSADNSDIMRLLDLAGRPEDVDVNDSDKDDYEESNQDFPLTKLPQIGNLPRSSIDILENLIFRMTLLVNKRPELGKTETIMTLIRAIGVFGADNNFSGSLTNILQESQFYSQVIKQGVAHRLYQLSKLMDLQRVSYCFLDTLTCVGESNYGKAELASLLRGADEASQKRAAIAVAYTIKDFRLLYQFLNEGNVLTLLLNVILSNKRDEFTAEAVDALTCMSKNTLGISVPLLDVSARDKDYSEFDEETEGGNRLLPANDCDMRFVVHDSDAENENDREREADRGDVACTTDQRHVTTVAFNKQLLCDVSEVFNTMLNSDFREGNEGEIHLRTYSPSGLKYFLNLVVRKSQGLPFNIPPLNKYHALLEVFEMSRIYIIPEVEQFALKMLISLLDASNCLSVLEWAMKNYHVELTEMAVNYYLCSVLTTDEKVTLFHNAEYSKYSAEWFQMLIDVVLVRCRNGF